MKCKGCDMTERTVQWALIDIESREIIASIGDPFSLTKIMGEYCEQENNRLINGTGESEPVGILSIFSQKGGLGKC